MLSHRITLLVVEGKGAQSKAGVDQCHMFEVEKKHHERSERGTLIRRGWGDPGRLPGGGITYLNWVVVK